MNGQWWNQQMPTGLPQMWNQMSMYGGGGQSSPQGVTSYGRALGQYTRQPWYEKYKRTPFNWSGQRAMNSPSYRGMYGTPATVSAPAATAPAPAAPSFNAMLAPGFGPANPAMTAYSGWMAQNPGASMEEFYKLYPQYKGGTAATKPTASPIRPVGEWNWMY